MSKLILLEYLAFFPPFLVFPHLQMQKIENRLNYRSFIKPYRWRIESLKTIVLRPKPAASETQTRKKRVSGPRPCLETLSVVDSLVECEGRELIAVKYSSN